jgi:hypothetical protein
MGSGSGTTGSERTGTAGHAGAAKPSTPSDWAKKNLADMVEYFGRYYLPYRRLRIDSVTDELARLVARLANFDENSDQFLAIRCLVRAWREENYVDYLPEAGKSTINGFLFDYDLSYRLRRLNFTRTQVDRIARGDPDLIEELKHHRESLVKVRKEMRETRRDDQEEWREVIEKFPQIRLQIYGEKLLPFAEQKSPQLATQLRFIKSELHEVYKQLRATGRLLRSRRQPPTPEAAQAGVVPHSGPESLNPLLGLIDQIGITPQDLNDILGVSLSAGSGNGSRTVTKEQRQDEEDCFKRAVAMLKRSEKSHIKDNLQAIAAELRAQLHDVFALNRQKCSQGLFALDDRQQALYEPLSPRGKELLAGDANLLSSDMAQAVRGFLGYYYHNFDDYDQIRFPIVYKTDVGEADVVEVIRISPEDATSLINEREELQSRKGDKKARRKLAGVSLHHFGAFLDQTWRQNDIMWGRLDGAERLISALLPGTQNASVRQELINEAHTAILKEELKPQSLLALRSVMSEALLRASTSLSVNEAIGKALEPLEASVVKTRLEEIIRLSLADDELLDFMKQGYEVNRQLDPKLMLNSMSRATQIIGKMFENIADANALDGKQLAWIARLGQVFWGLVTVAVPHSIVNLLIFHWLKLLYLFGALLILGSVLLGQLEVQKFGWTALGATVAINVCVLLLRDYMLHGKYRWLRAFQVVVFLTVIFLAAIGADEVFNLGLRTRLLAMLQGVMSWM